MSNPHHEKAQCALRECTLVELIFCKTEIAARELEMVLIQEMSPLYNVACRKNNSVTTTRNG